MKAPPPSFLKWTCFKQIVIVRFAANNLRQFVAFFRSQFVSDARWRQQFQSADKKLFQRRCVRNYSPLPNKLSSVEEGILNKFNFNVVENLRILFRKFYSSKSSKRALWSIALVHFWPNSTPICQQYLSKQKIFVNNILWEKKKLQTENILKVICKLFILKGKYSQQHLHLHLYLRQN